MKFRRLGQRRIAKLKLVTQILLLLFGVISCLISSQLIGLLDELCKPNLNSSTTAVAKTPDIYVLTYVSLMLLGVIQSTSSVALIIIRILCGRIAQTQCVVGELVSTGIQILLCLICLGATSNFYSYLDHSLPCFNDSFHVELVYGLPCVIFILTVSLCLHLMVIFLLVSLNFPGVIKSSSPPKVRLESFKSPSTCPSGSDAKEKRESTDFMGIPSILRTRLTSLRSLHPTHPPSPGFIGSLSQLPVTPIGSALMEPVNTSTEMRTPVIHDRE